MNAGPIAMELLAGARQEDEAGRFLAGLVVARVPLFLFQAVQASLLPRLSQLASEGRADEFRSGLARLVGLVAGIAVLGGIVAFVAGPTVVHLLFGGDFQLPHRTMGLLGLGSGAFMVASLLAQASIALDGHRPMALAWGVGIVALGVTMATVSSDLFLRVELGGVAGGLGALVAQALVLRVLLRSGVPIETGNLIEAIHDVALEP
jgi:O-antigen/teichoic acid export membrane protein